jgi:hypothetical protein
MRLGTVPASASYGKRSGASLSISEKDCIQLNRIDDVISMKKQ